MGGTEHCPTQPDTQTRVLLFGPGVGALTELPLGAELRRGEPAWEPARGTGIAREGRARRHFRWGRGRELRGRELRRRPRPSAAPARPQLVRLRLRWQGS